MDLRFRQHAFGGWSVLELSGEADLSTLPLLYERVNRFVSEAPSGQAIVDLTDLQSLEPVTLGVFIAARLHLQARDGDLHLVCADPPIRTVFARSGLDTIFSLHNTVADVVTGLERRTPR
jgi:anti-anti-sigma factor